MVSATVPHGRLIMHDTYLSHLLFNMIMFENRVLRRIFGPKREEVTGNGENYIMRSLMFCTPHPILCG